jgi:nitrate/TMAO reductase-like tetraheme cytochrome c subunit
MPGVIKKICAVAGVFAAIGVAGAVGVIQVSHKPPFCKICHNMAPYYESWKEGALLAKKHADASLVCHDCHLPSIVLQVEEGIKFVTGNYKNPLDKRDMGNAFCLDCHDFDEVKVKILESIVVANPHESHYGDMNCSICHRMHERSELLCAQCHREQWAKDILKDEGWAAKR